MVLREHEAAVEQARRTIITGGTLEGRETSAGVVGRQRQVAKQRVSVSPRARG